MIASLIWQMSRSMAENSRPQTIGIATTRRVSLLNGLHATTHFGAIDELRKMAPEATIHPEARGVDNGKIVLSTGVSAGTDMALFMISRICDLETAAETAKSMHFDWRYHDVDGNSIIRQMAA